MQRDYKILVLMHASLGKASFELTSQVLFEFFFLFGTAISIYLETLIPFPRLSNLGTENVWFIYSLFILSFSFISPQKNGWAGPL